MDSESLQAGSDRLLSVREVAALLNVQPKTIYHWTQAGGFPYVKVGRLLRFHRADVLRWVEKTTYRPRER
ncbi:helix-turn-helix domain-containing protein [Candidatus Poribacteria bacterium]|nr:helix-turn-helix domain-containing protein [Candidatus Poribacteria bacterium]